MSRLSNHDPLAGGSAPANHLRVAIVASSLRLAGAEKQTVYMARALREAGIDVRLFYLGSGGHYAGVLANLQVPLAQIFAPNRPGVMLARLIGTWLRWRPQIVLASQFSDLRYGGIAGRLCRALTLGAVRSDGFYELDTHGRWSPWMFRLAHGLIANSVRATRNLASRGFDPDKMKVLPNVIDLEAFDADPGPDPLPSLPAGRVVAAAVGSLHSCKRFDRFLDALARARRRAPELAGVIAGRDCGAQAALQAQARALDLAPPDFVFLGRCETIPALLRRVNVLVLSSEYEGFPNVILEAMAARLPVITTPAGDAAQIVLDGRTGYVVGAKDVGAMAERLVQLAQSPTVREQWGAAGRQRAEQDYSYGFLASRLLSVMRHFAERQPRLAAALAGCQRLSAAGTPAPIPTIVGPPSTPRPSHGRLIEA